VLISISSLQRAEFYFVACNLAPGNAFLLSRRLSGAQTTFGESLRMIEKRRALCNWLA
jgi:hypothetical protein